MSLHGRIVEIVERRVPRRTIRFRLTLVYGGLFLLFGAVLLGVTYLMVSQSSTGIVVAHTGHGTTVAVQGSSRATPPHALRGQVGFTTVHSSGGKAVRGVKGLTPAQARQQGETLLAQAVAQRNNEEHQLLVYAGLGLALMAGVAFALGWVMAGKVLRPLRTITATVRDISASRLHERLGLEGPDDELKELGDTFDALLARLERSFHAQRQFVANASHELRTPLARQKVLSQVALADESATVESLRAAHERVLASGEQQERLIDALLALSRGQAGTERRDVIDLADVAERVVLGLEHEARSLGVELCLRAAPAALGGDARLVERLVTNLADNAVRYNIAGGRVTVRTSSIGDRAVVSVANTGPAVSADDVERMVQPFLRLGADRTADGRGLGLGLSIVQAIADAHGASLTIRPRAGGGLEAEVAFPAAGVAAGPASVAPERTMPSLAGR